MGRPRKDEEALPERIEARRWKNGTTVTYRYLSPAGPKVYLGTDREQALEAYNRLIWKHSGAKLDPRVAASVEKHRKANAAPGAPLTRFHARAVINAVGRPPNSHGNQTVPNDLRGSEQPKR